MHNRLEPKKHKFHYNVFMFYIDLDEIDQLKKFLLISHNKFNFFNFKDKEHLRLPMGLPTGQAGKPDDSKSTKEHILNYLSQNGVAAPKKIMLLTNLNTLGYNFNPVSFYYCFDQHDEPMCCVAEVSNTFREMKPYFIGKDKFEKESFKLHIAKDFYVSPFIDHDAYFDFDLSVPGEKLNIRIDDQKNGKRFFISTLTGTKKPLTNGNLFWYAIRFPLIPLWIMGLIHWNALLLWLKKIRYYKKGEFPELQKDVYNRTEN